MKSGCCSRGCGRPRGPHAPAGGRAEPCAAEVGGPAGVHSAPGTTQGPQASAPVPGGPGRGNCGLTGFARRSQPAVTPPRGRDAGADGRGGLCSPPRAPRGPLLPGPRGPRGCPAPAPGRGGGKNEATASGARQGPWWPRPRPPVTARGFAVAAGERTGARGRPRAPAFPPPRPSRGPFPLPGAVGAGVQAPPLLGPGVPGRPPRVT